MMHPVPVDETVSHLGAVLITKSPLVINYFKQLLNSGWPYIVLIIVIVIFAGTSLWALVSVQER